MSNFPRSQIFQNYFIILAFSLCKASATYSRALRSQDVVNINSRLLVLSTGWEKWCIYLTLLQNFDNFFFKDLVKTCAKVGGPIQFRWCYI